MNRKAQLLLVLSGLLVVIAVSQAIPSVLRTTVSTREITIPFELINRQIILKVKVGDSRPFSFVLDTGAQMAIINLDRAKELGLRLQGAVRMGGAGPETPTGAFVREASFTVLGLPAFSQPVKLALPLANLAPRAGHDFDGIIGSEFIQEFVVEVDYQARVLKLHDKAKFTYSGSGQSIPIQLTHGHPILTAEVTPVNGQPLKGRFVLDLGSSLALALHSPFIEEHRLLGPDLKTIRSLGGLGAGGKTVGRVGRVSELKIGTFRINNPITLFSEDKAGAFASTALAGNIGAQVASKFRVFLDYERSRIILEPNSNYSSPFDRAFAGLSLVAEGKDYSTFRVREILEDSPASEVDMQVDDIIVAINGKPASELTLSNLNEMLERPVTYGLIVRRGEQTLRIALTPRRLI
ncbi:MAG TPA: aspartyl protease family protein [Pyrinomonadaceae bacterium]|nr:aspartyl protease family protein [Pyrinomonadaceae bacterium]